MKNLFSILAMLSLADTVAAMEAPLDAPLSVRTVSPSAISPRPASDALVSRLGMCKEQLAKIQADRADLQHSLKELARKMDGEVAQSLRAEVAEAGKVADDLRAIKVRARHYLRDSLAASLDWSVWDIEGFISEGRRRIRTAEEDAKAERTLLGQRREQLREEGKLLDSLETAARDCLALVIADEEAQSRAAELGALRSVSDPKPSPLGPAALTSNDSLKGKE